jgi:hypothetical protein
VTTASWARVRRARGSRTPGPKLPTPCAGWLSPGLYQVFTLGGRQSVVPACTRSSRGVLARLVSNLVSIGVPVPSGRGRLRRSGPPRPGTDRLAGHGKADQGLERAAGYLSVWSSTSVLAALRLADWMPLMALACSGHACAHMAPIHPR